MKIEKRYLIKEKKDLIFAKLDLKNYLKDFIDIDFFIFALMELGTNLYKHTDGGEIWILKEGEKRAIASLDKGKGIKNINWALEKGTTTYKGSMGIGLYQLSRNDKYKFEIFSKENVGTIILLHDFNLKEVYLSESYYNNDINGDFFAKKGHFFLFGDASGHGIKAYKSAEFVKKIFLNTLFSCSFIEDFFREIDKKIKEKSLRGAVLSIIEVTKSRFKICGVGNISMIYHNELITQKDGVIGVVFSNASKYEFSRNDRLIIFSDGILFENIKNFLYIKSDYLLALCSIFYSPVLDDKSILILR